VKDKNDIAEVHAVELLRAGDIAAFGYLFEKYSKELHHFALRILKSQPDADEVVQDVFLKIWEKRRQIDPGQLFSPYLFTIALNNIRKKFLCKARENRFKVELYDELVLGTPEEPEEKNFANYLKMLDDQIDKLPEKRRQIFLMHKKEGLTVSEVSSYLNVSPKTVENQITAAIKAIREAFNEKNIKGLYLFIVRLCCQKPIQKFS
jgi:RNA polymerase sigma-70 factor (ECF subfamily)